MGPDANETASGRNISRELSRSSSDTALQKPTLGLAALEMLAFQRPARQLQINPSRWGSAVPAVYATSDSGRPQPPLPFRRLSRRSGRIPAEPYPPLKCLHCNPMQNSYSGPKAVNSGGLGAEPPIQQMRFFPSILHRILPTDSATEPDFLPMNE